MVRVPHKARMFALGGDAFPNDTESLRTALIRGAKPFGAGEDAVGIAGNFPSVEALRMNLTGARLDAKVPPVAQGKAEGGFFSRALDLTAEPARLAAVPIHIRLHAEDCVFAFGTAADGTRTASLQSCTNGTLDASAATVDLEAALLTLAHSAAAAHGAEVKSVQLTLDAENPRTIAVTAVAVAKAMFLTATLTRISPPRSSARALWNSRDRHFPSAHSCPPGCSRRRSHSREVLHCASWRRLAVNKNLVSFVNFAFHPTAHPGERFLKPAHKDRTAPPPQPFEYEDFNIRPRSPHLRSIWRTSLGAPAGDIPECQD